jgi:hypothetical protein
MSIKVIMMVSYFIQVKVVNMSLQAKGIFQHKEYL